MKKIINGKMYNTETATAIYTHESNHSTNDFRYFRTTLFKKKTGEFFVHGEGGPMTSYATRENDNCWSWGEIIRPVTIEMAKNWLEDFGTAEVYEETFGEVEE